LAPARPLGPVRSWVGLGAGCGPWSGSGGSNAQRRMLAHGPLGSVAGGGGPWPRPAPGLAPLPLLRTGGCRPARGELRPPRVPGSWALAATPAPSTGFGNMAAPRCWHCVYPDRLKLPSPAHFHNSQSGQVLCRITLALWRKSGPRVALPAGTPAVLPGRYVALVDPTGLFRRPARCSAWSYSQRACSNGRPQRLPPFLHAHACAASPRALWLG
jgi:hypothetical protein